jgi:hypothetical protein
MGGYRGHRHAEKFRVWISGQVHPDTEAKLVWTAEKDSCAYGPAGTLEAMFSVRWCR